MTLALRTRPRAIVLAFVFVLVTAAVSSLAASPAAAQTNVGAAATKDCPSAPGDPYTIGDTVTCFFTVENIGDNAAQVISLTETSPVPGGTPVPVTCTVNGTTIGEGGILQPGDVCEGSFVATIPNDPALCGTSIVDSIDIELLDTTLDEQSGASTEHVLTVECGPPEVFSFGAVEPVCIADAPYIAITFPDRPDLDGQQGTLSFYDVNNTLIEERPLTFQSGATVNVIYPGAEVDAEGNAVDWPGWVENEDGLWVTDPTDAIWRDGLNLVYEVNPTATAFVAYPPASAACASPENPPGANPPGELPATGRETGTLLLLASLALAVGAGLLATVRRRRAHE